MGDFVLATVPQISNAKNNLTLYRLVYQGRLGTMAVLLLCLSFFVQGANMAEANEEQVASEVVIDTGFATDEVTTSPPEIETLESPTENTSPEVVFDMEEELSEETILTDGEDILVDEFSEPEDENETDLFDDIAGEPTIDSETGLADDEDDIFIADESASTTAESGDLVAVAYSDDSFSFNKAECTELASGSFYCQKPQENTLEDALFAAPDADGDLEIFLVRAGEQVQVTFNQTDDAAPFYDQNSDSIVWHRLIDDRYQIVSYDIESGEEEVMTKTGENNMEPNRQGRFTVWQRWIDGGWNIILHDGESEEQITKTTSHNVAPYIHGTLVVWNRHDQVNDRTIEMYDLVTKTYVSIEDPEGMSVSNPRMVFVYDSVQPNGDITTKGYDMLAKKFIDLDTLPRSLPDELPESDSTGETRALIQNKPSGKSEVEEVTDDQVATSTSGFIGTTTPVLSDNSASSSLTLDLSTASPVLAEPEVFAAEDLVIPPSTTIELLPEAEEVVEFVMPE